MPEQLPLSNARLVLLLALAARLAVAGVPPRSSAVGLLSNVPACSPHSGNSASTARGLIVPIRLQTPDIIPVYY